MTFQYLNRYIQILYTKTKRLRFENGCRATFEYCNSISHFCILNFRVGFVFVILIALIDNLNNSLLFLI